MRWLILGVLLAAAPIGRSWAPSSPRPGPVVHWAADRGGHAVVGLDRELFVARRVELRWPCFVARGPAGEAWVASAREGHDAGRFSIHLLGSGASWEVRGVRALAGETPGAALVLCASPDSSSLVRVGPHPPGELEAFEGVATCLALGHGRALVGFRSGELVSLVPGGDGRGATDRHPRLAHVAEPVRGVAAGPGGGWWVLDGRGVLERLDGELRCVGRAVLPLEDPRLARCDGGEGAGGIWCVDGRGGRAAWMGADGRGHLVEDLPVAGFEAARMLPGGGCLAAGGGALLRWTRAGAVDRGQGGLAFVASL